MQLLHCRPIPAAEFASLSLLLKNGGSRSVLGDSITVASPLTTIPSSLTMSCIGELHEYINSLFEQASSDIAMPPSNKQKGCVSEQLLQDDARVLGAGDPVHLHHLSRGHGLHMQYAVIQDAIIVKKCASIILQKAQKSSVESVAGVVLCVGVSGLISANNYSSLLARQMRDCLTVIERLGSVSDLAECQTCVKSVLSAMILSDDEERRTNAMAEFESVALMSDLEGDMSNEKLKSVVSPIGVVRKTKKSKRVATLKGESMGSSDMRLTVEAASSADTARITAETMAILSVAEGESQLRKYESTGLQRRSNMTIALGKSRSRVRRRKARNEDLEDFDCPEIPHTKLQNVPILRRPGVDTPSQMILGLDNNSSQQSPTKKAGLPTILAPRNDVAIRRANQHPARRRMSGGASSGSRKGSEIAPAPTQFPLAPSASTLSSPPGQTAFNVFESSNRNETQMNEAFPSQHFSGVGDERGSRQGPSNNVVLNGGDPWGMISAAPTTEFNAIAAAPGESVPSFDVPVNSSETGRRFESVPDPASSAGIPLGQSVSTVSPPIPAGSPSQRRPVLDEERQKKARDTALETLQRMLLASDQNESNGLNDDDMSRGSHGDRSTTSYQNGEWAPPVLSEQLRDAYSELDQLVAKVTPVVGSEQGVDRLQPRIMINVALNEDLICSYRQSKMSSCSIEGVVQVQVSCDARDGVPFFLLVRDPSRHINVMQENRRYADDMTESILSENSDDAGVDYKYTVSVPSADDYFPVMRYKCNTGLRPVPIRVQTRVRVNDKTSCRVALQISSNPANEDDLTDLTIVMGVPVQVKGESLVTTPPGGVWNAAKRSVIWCVAELGGGEKFQLQAEFEMNPDVSPLPTGAKPKFPVLVRCQCMYAQLSDVELEVSDIADIYPADVAMKLARRFRLSHRERS